ncbi:MAG: SPASM domain-containing protein [Clostridiales bacterium]|jgi:hypothetical protein|nr:SPASM domain-containing protein [Clostridiales bacterium]
MIFKKKIVLFGAGDYGKKALEHFGSDNVEFFVDNNKSKCGEFFCGKKVIHFSEYESISSSYNTVISTAFSQKVEEQLNDCGILVYSIFSHESDSKFRFYDEDELVIEQFRTEKADHSEEEYNEYTKRINTEGGRFDRINKEAYRFQSDVPLFKYVEIETINRCNGVCGFCPVNKRDDTRDELFMKDELFYDIISQLKEIHYKGAISLFSNNEPMLDRRLVDFCRYAKKELPDAYHYIFTNGTLLTLGKFIPLAECLDELIIDNYTTNGNLLKTCSAIKDYVELERHELIKKVTIVIRNPNEILTSRGGDAPNRTKKASYPDVKCLMPYWQVVIRPDGKLSLCCNDPLGKCTLGDLAKEKLIDAWYGKEYTTVRNALSKGRGNYWHCKHCDYFRL